MAVTLFPTTPAGAQRDGAFDFFRRTTAGLGELEGPPEGNFAQDGPTLTALGLKLGGTFGDVTPGNPFIVADKLSYAIIGGEVTGRARLGSTNNIGLLEDKLHWWNVQLTGYAWTFELEEQANNSDKCVTTTGFEVALYGMTQHGLLGFFVSDNAKGEGSWYSTFGLVGRCYSDFLIPRSWDFRFGGIEGNRGQ